MNRGALLVLLFSLSVAGASAQQGLLWSRVRTGAEFAASIADPTVDVVLLVEDVLLSDEDWAPFPLPVELTRNLTIAGQPDSRNNVPVLDLAVVRNKVRLHGGNTLTFRNLVLLRWREGSSNQAPGLSLLTPTVAPPNSNGAVAIMRLQSVGMQYRYCFPLYIAPRAAAAFARPAALPGNNTYEWNTTWPANCSQSPWAPPLERCFAFVGRYLDVGTTGLDVDSNGKTNLNGYLVHYVETTALCTNVMPDDCIAKLQPVGCSLYLNSLPEAPPPPRPLPPLASPPEPGSLTDSRGGDRAATIGGAVGGAVGGVLLVCVIAGLWVLAARRRRRSGDGGGLSASTSATAKSMADTNNSSLTAGGTTVGTGSAGGYVVMSMGPGGVPIMSSAGSAATSSKQPPHHKQQPPRLGAASSYDLGSSEASTTTTATTPSRQHERVRGRPGGGASSSSPKFTSGSSRSTALFTLGMGRSPGGPSSTVEETPVVTQATPPRADVKLDVRVGEPPLVAAATTPEGQAAAAAAAAAAQAVSGSEAPFSSVDGAATFLSDESVPRPADALEHLGVGRTRSARESLTSEVRLTAVTLGKGAFGRVMEGEWQGQRVAVKVVADMHQFGGAPDVLLKCFSQELEVLARCAHPNVVRLLAACPTPPRLCLIMELMETSLDRLLHGKKPMRLNLRKVLYIGSQIARGLEYLHPTVIHRDLKPANVLICDAAGPRPVVKITDFGLSRLRNTTVITTTPGAGTPGYLAPECYEDGVTGAITYQADMYSLGVLLWEMLTHSRPWEGLAPVQIAVGVAVQHKRLPLDNVPPSRCPPQLRDLIEQMWDADPLRRPAAAEVVKVLEFMLERMDAETAAAVSTVEDSDGPSTGPTAGGMTTNATITSDDTGGQGGGTTVTEEDYDYGPILAVSFC